MEISDGGRAGLAHMLSLHVVCSNGLTPSIQSLTATSSYLSALYVPPHFLASRLFIMLMYLAELFPDVLEVLIGTLTHFFTFTVDFYPESQNINKTTHTSSYTYWFLVLSAEILTKYIANIGL